MLSLWDRDHFEAEVGPIGWRPSRRRAVHRSPQRPHEGEVDAVLATARAAGADPVHDGEEREWGGYTGYFADPDGYRWEVAYNPGPIGEVVLP